ncbi:MAG: porin, partial [bacterium]
MNVRNIFLILLVLTFSAYTFALGSEEVTTKTSTLTIGGRLQTQYQFVDSTPYTNRLILRRARLSFQSQLTEWAYMKVQIEAGKQSFTLKDAYIGFNLKGFSLFFGQKHVPFSREALNSSKYLQMIERCRTSEFAPFRQMGVGVHGFALDKKLEYSAGIYNGAVNSSSVSNLGANILSKVKIYNIDAGASGDNNKFLYAGRVDFHPFGFMKKSQSYLEDLEHPLLSLGVNFIYSDESPSSGHTDGVAELKKTSAYGGDAALKYKGFAGTLEYIHRNLSWWNDADVVNDAAQDTFTLQGGYMIIPEKLELTARFEYVKYDKDKILLGPAGQNKDNWLIFGFNYFFEAH